VAPTKTQTQPQRPVAISAELEEQVVIDRMGDAIAEAAADQRRALLAEDARRAARRAAVEIASAALSANSAATAAHSDDVDVISEAIARRLGLSQQSVDDVIVAARLHDIGKLGVPQRIIDKPGALDDDEWAVIRRHTIIGEQILIAVPELRGAAYLVRHSHERWDGAGYPDGLAGEEIPLGSRIVFCADAYHAIRSDRPYRQGRSAAEALDEIRSCAGTQFDPRVVEALEGLAGDLRKERNDNRPRPIRYRRLMALMMIVSIGACSSALARSGVMPEAKASPSSSGSGSISGAPAPAGAALQSSNAPSATGSPSAKLTIGEATGSAGRTALLTQLPAGLAVPPAALEGPSLDEPTDGIDDVLPGAPQTVTPHGVRDGGHGVGRGKGKGKGRGAELGRGHLPKAAKPLGSGKGKAVAKGKKTVEKAKASAEKVSKKTSTTVANASETIQGAAGKLKPKDSASGGKVKPVKLPSQDEIVTVPKPPQPIPTPNPGTGVSVPGGGGGGLTGNQNTGGNGGNGNAGG
jgi:hypothetical protein